MYVPSVEKSPSWVEVEQEAHLVAVGLPMAAWGFQCHHFLKIWDINGIINGMMDNGIIIKIWTMEYTRI